MSASIARVCSKVGCVGLMIALAGCSHGGFSSASQPGPAPAVTSFNFDHTPVGQLPSGFTVAQTSGGEPPQWVVQKDPKAASGRHVLAQLNADPTRGRFPLCICDSIKARNVDVSVQYKAISGKVDQAAGIVIRLQDKDNYYVTRANAIEDNIRFYKVQAGKRTQLATARLQTTSNQWHTLRLKAVGNHFEVFHDGQKMLDVQDDTFPQAGKAGLWTKADSATYFDDLKITTLAD